MIGLLQRVTEASVRIDGECVGAIASGLLVLVAVQPQDNEATAQRLLERLLTYRVFADDTGRMNRALCDTGGGLLLVPPFTTADDPRSGHRAGFSKGAAPAHAPETVSAWVRERL